MPKAAPKTKAKKIVVPGKPSAPEKTTLLETLQERFEANQHRHPDLSWAEVETKLKPTTIQAVYAMEETGGEPDVVLIDGAICFVDCSEQSPARRSVCYDKQARTERKKFPPDTSAEELAQQMGVQLMTEEQYRQLQAVGDFDTTTSSWLQTPEQIRQAGGAIFGDKRYGQLFVYHNGADSYYGSRGFRGLVWL